VASTSALRKAALSGTAISEQELRETLRALRRAVRASLSA
jgi:hypothetical protein